MFKLLPFSLLLATSVAVAGSAVISWNNPTANTDGSTIPSTGPGSLVSTRVEWGSCSGSAFGTSQGNILVNQPSTSAEISDLAPGLYCFRAFAKNTFGSESLASNIASKEVPQANVAPVLTNPGNQSTIRGVAVTLQLVASDANGGILTYSATGLPTGIVVNANGLFSGSPTTVGNYTVTARVVDNGGLSDSATFDWIISNPPVPNPPLITVETFAYKYNTRKLVERSLAYVELGVPCMDTPILVVEGKTYYEVSSKYVTTSSRKSSGRYMAACG